MQLTKICLSLLFSLFIVTSFSQIKGKAKHLPGTWVYQKGSGFEIWTLVNGELQGAGYRTNKIGDTIRVESLGIREVNNHLFYTLETGISVGQDSTSYTKHQFMSKRRKLYFTNVENRLPSHLKYSFGCFNKNKLTITVEMNDHMKKTKLVLRRQD